MRGKLMFITGGLAGYVLGARAGRKRYEQIAASASELWHAKPVQRRVAEVRDYALETIGDIPVALFNVGKSLFKAGRAKKKRSKAVGFAPSASGDDASGTGKPGGAASAKPTEQASPTSGEATGGSPSTKSADTAGEQTADTGPDQSKVSDGKPARTSGAGSAQGGKAAKTGRAAKSGTSEKSTDTSGSGASGSSDDTTEK